jgi:crossover junction endodeoxyribonuclease RuvC
MRPWIRVLGIDPGFRVTGYGVVDTNGQESRHITSGVIQVAKIDSGAGRLERIFAAVGEIVEAYQPIELAVERVFVHKNADSALKLGQARAAAICASFGRNIPVFEYAAREVKQAIVGRGGAGKEQVQHMVRVLLGMNAAIELPEDAADALGIALCHAHTRTLSKRYAEALG